MSAPFFSIIIPTYNRSNRIHLAVNSALTQDFKDYEIIIVDDGSTDDTETVVSQIQNPRLRYFKKVNEERSIARNFGVSAANGKYVSFLDSDDKLNCNHFDVAYKLITSNNFPEVCHLGYETINDNGEKIFEHNDLHINTEDRLIEENIFCCNSIFIKREIAIAYPFINDRNAVISEDWYVWLRLISRFKICFDNTITSSVIEHNERSLRNINPDKLIASTELIIDNLKKDKIFKSRFGTKANFFFSNQYTLISLVLALTKQRRFMVLKYLLKAIKYDASVLLRRRFLASIKHLL